MNYATKLPPDILVTQGFAGAVDLVAVENFSRHDKLPAPRGLRKAIRDARKNHFEYAFVATRAGDPGDNLFGGFPEADMPLITATIARFMRGGSVVWRMHAGSAR